MASEKVGETGLLGMPPVDATTSLDSEVSDEGDSHHGSSEDASDEVVATSSELEDDELGSSVFVIVTVCVPVSPGRVGSMTVV